MEVTQSLIYWISRLDPIFHLAMGTMLASLMGMAGLLVVYTTDQDNKCIKYLKGFILPLCLSIATLVFVPTTKDMAAILVIPAVANNEDVQEISQDLVNLAKDWIKEKSPQ